MTRFFIALEIPEECREQIREIQLELRRIFPNLRLTDLDKLHLTVAFIGEQKEELKENLIEIMKKAVSDIAPFSVTPAYIGGFPRLHTARVLWLGVKGDIQNLIILQERIKDGLIEFNLSVDERRYEPHVTIAKTYNFDLSPIDEQKLENLMMHQFKPISITSLKLFESVPSGGLHTHNTLAEISLTASK